MKCSSCGCENREGAKFCDSCGQPLAEPSAPDPRSYTPKHLAEKILQSKSALEGERKQVTVLFADVKGSMDLSESIDPEDWHHIMELTPPVRSRPRSQTAVHPTVPRSPAHFLS